MTVKRTPDRLSLRFILIAIVIITALPIQSASPQPVKPPAVTFQGNTFFSSRTLLKFLEKHAVQSTTARLSELKRLYNWNGFNPSFHINHDIIEGKSQTTILIEEGKRFQITQIDWNGNQFFTNRELQEKIDLRPGQFPTLQRLEDDLEAVLTAYTRSGFPFAEITPVVRFQPDSLRITIQIHENGRYILSNLRVAEDIQTRPEVLRRQMRLAIGEFFDSERLKRGKQRLLRLPFIQAVPEADLVIIAPDSVELVLKIEEGRANRGEGVIGYAPGNGDEDGYFNGYVEVQFSNLFGTARRLFVHWSRPQQDQEDFDFSYFEPWIARTPVSGQITFSRSLWDTLYTKTTTRLRLEASFWHQFTAYAAGQSSRGQETLVTGDRQSSQKYQIDWGARFDNRDFPLNPTRGIDYELGWSIGWREGDAISGDSQEERTFQLRMAHFVPFTGMFVGFAEFNLQRYQGPNRDQIPYYDQFPLGGTYSLRGYEEQQFRGTSIAWTNFELRYRLSRRSRVFLFFDAGQYQPDAWDKPLTGYGLGVRLEAKIGLIGLDYGLGEDDSLTNGKLHFSLENEF